MHVRDHCSNVLVLLNVLSCIYLFSMKHCIPIDVTDDENQNVSGRKSSPAGVVFAGNTSHSDFKGFAYEQDDYYKVHV